MSLPTICVCNQSSELTSDSTYLRESRRVPAALLLSLLIHGVLLSLVFDGSGPGLPGLGLPWQERRFAADDLQVVLAPPASVPVSATAVASEESSARTQAKESPTPTAMAVSQAVTWTEPVPAKMPNKVPTKVPLTTPALADVPRSEPILPLVQEARVAPVPPTPVITAAPDTASPEVVRAAVPDAVDTAQKQREQDTAQREAALAKNEAQRKLEQAEAERLDVARAEAAARLEAQRQEAARKSAALKEDSARLESTRLEAESKAQAQAQREEQAQREVQAQAQKEAARVELARAVATRLEAERQQAAKAESARLESERLEAVRKAAARSDVERAQAARLDAERQEGARQAAVRADQDARRDAARRAMGRQLDEEAAARREAADLAQRASPTLPYSVNSARRGRLFGRTDSNAELLMYGEAWSRKIQLNMTFDMVREAAKLPHATPLVTVAIRKDGSVEAVTFVTSSGVPALDDAIRRIVQSQAPYAAFSPLLASEFDVIEVRRSWNFDMAVRLY